MDEETLYTYKESIKETIYGEINSYTSKKYDIVHNIISNKYLIKLKNKTHWEELNLSSLKIELIAAGIKTSKDVLETFMSSHLVGKINPLEMFFKDLDECMKNKQNTALFIKYLREEVKCNWTSGDFQKYRPLTEAYKKQQALSAKNYMKFISHIISDEDITYNDTRKYDWTKYAGRLTVCIKQKEM